MHSESNIGTVKSILCQLFSSSVLVLVSCCCQRFDCTERFYSRLPPGVHALLPQWCITACYVGVAVLQRWWTLASCGVPFVPWCWHEMIFTRTCSWLLSCTADDSSIMSFQNSNASSYPFGRSRRSVTANSIWCCLLYEVLASRLIYLPCFGGRLVFRHRHHHWIISCEKCRCDPNLSTNCNVFVSWYSWFTAITNPATTVTISPYIIYWYAFFWVSLVIFLLSFFMFIQSWASNISWLESVHFRIFMFHTAVGWMTMSGVWLQFFQRS